MLGSFFIPLLYGGYYVNKQKLQETGVYRTSRQTSFIRYEGRTRFLDHSSYIHCSTSRFVGIPLLKRFMQTSGIAMFDFDTWMKLPPWKPAWKPADKQCPHCDLDSSFASECCNNHSRISGTKIQSKRKDDISYDEQLREAIFRPSMRTPTRKPTSQDRPRTSPTRSPSQPKSPTSRFDVARKFDDSELQRRLQQANSPEESQYRSNMMQRVFRSNESTQHTRGTRNLPSSRGGVHTPKSKSQKSFTIKYEGMFDLYPDVTGPRY